MLKLRNNSIAIIALLLTIISCNDDIELLDQSTPTIDNQSFSIEENSATGTLVGTVAATDSNGDAMTYTITAGNTNGAFALASETGALTVADMSQLDYETNPSFVLTVVVSDGSLLDEADITITLIDVDENISVTCTEYEEVDGIVVMEAENTDFSNTKWESRNSSPPLYNGSNSFTGTGYLEYRGDNAFREPDDNALEYTFKINNAGTYFLLIRGFKNHNQEGSNVPFEEDLNNDCWVKMSGDFDAVSRSSNIKRFSSDNENGTEYPGASKEVLESYTKLFMSFSDWYSTRFLEYGDPIVKVEPMYNFKAGEEYTLSIKGRSFQYDIDRIYIFRLFDENGDVDYDYQPRYEVSGLGRNNFLGDTEMVSPSEEETKCP